MNKCGMEKTELVKNFLSDETKKIALHDFVVGEIRTVLPKLSKELFPVGGQWSDKEFFSRIEKYESTVAELLEIQCLLSYWLKDGTSEVNALPLRRLAAPIGIDSGINILLGLRWYPIQLLLYVGGISAIYANKYQNLYQLFHSKGPDPDRSNGSISLLESINVGLSDISTGFKRLPGRKNNYVPESEHMFVKLQPILDDILFLSTDYEDLYDRFEVIQALEMAHINSKANPNNFWGPVGRFAWKANHGRHSNPLMILLEEAKSSGKDWPPLLAGLFDGSIDRFVEVHAKYLHRVQNLVSCHACSDV